LDKFTKSEIYKDYVGYFEKNEMMGREVNLEAKNNKQKSGLDDLIKKYDYVGWIPNLSKWLYFSYCECRSGISDRLTLNFSKAEGGGKKTKHSRHVFITSIDNATDWYKDDEHSGHLRYIFTGKTDPDFDRDKSLRGEIYLIFPKETNTPQKNSSEIEKKFSETISTNKNKSEEVYQQFRCGGISSETFQNEFTKCHENLLAITKKLVSDNSGFFVVKIDYEVIKEGFIGLSLDKSKSTLDETSMSYDMHGRCAPRVVDLAYYYIKFSLHKNYHHNSRHDAATGLATTTLLKDDKSGSINKSDAAHIFVGYIRRAIIDARRRSLKNDIDVSGFAAYGKSLIKALNNLGYTNTCSETDSMEYFQESTEAYSRRLGVDERVRNYFSFTTIFTKSAVVLFAFLTPILLFWLNSAPSTDYVDGKFEIFLVTYLGILLFIITITYIYVTKILKPANEESTHKRLIFDLFYNCPSGFELHFFEKKEPGEIKEILKQWKNLPKITLYSNIITLYWNGNNNYSKLKKIYLISKMFFKRLVRL
jgi:hypothetical protein